jgi:hypothetical protein
MIEIMVWGMDAKATGNYTRPLKIKLNGVESGS